MLTRKSLLLTSKSEMLASNLLFHPDCYAARRRYSGADHDWKGLRECVGSLPAAPAGQSRCRISSARHRPAPWAGGNCFDQGVETVDVPGDHRTCLQEPHIHIAQRLNTALKTNRTAIHR